MARIGIIGSGNVGANTAFFVAEKAVGDAVLYDIREGLSPGKALDMMEAAPIRGYRSKITGTDTIEEILDSEIIIIAAGAVRSPGMKRADLFENNREVTTGLAEKLSGTQAKIIVVTEPVDLLTTHFARVSGLPAERVMGVGCLLDSVRLRYLLAQELGVSSENVNALVIGRHDDSMIPLTRYSTVSGVPVDQLITTERLEVLYEETIGAGSVIVEMAQRASAYYAPAAVAADLAEAIFLDTRRILPVSLMFSGQYGIEDVAMSLPAVIGGHGIERILEPELSADEKSRLVESANEITRIVGAA